MVKPVAICIEDLDSISAAGKYLRCVALPGRQPGLCLDQTGNLLWRGNIVPSCEIWVSADDRLILYRQEGMAPVVLRRGCRSLDVPCRKPVVMLDKDQIEVGPRRLRLHIHGTAKSVAAPSPLTLKSPMARRMARAATAAAIIGALATTGGCIDGGTSGGDPTDEIPVREEVPAQEP